MSTEMQDLLIEEHSIVGVRATGVHGGVEIRATLTVAADGRDSRLRRKAELVPIETGVPIDVLWLYLPKPQDPPPTILGYVSPHGMVRTLDRGDSYQAGAVIPKGRLAQLQAEGLDAFRARLVAAVPHLESVADTLTDWDQIKLLSVQLNHLPQWHRPGFIGVGDAAHAMSPVFGVGVRPPQPDPGHARLRRPPGAASGRAGAAGAGDPRPASPGEADRPRLPLGTTGPGWGCKHGRRG